VADRTEPVTLAADWTEAGLRERDMEKDGVENPAIRNMDVIAATAAFVLNDDMNEIALFICNNWR